MGRSRHGIIGPDDPTISYKNDIYSEVKREFKEFVDGFEPWKRLNKYIYCSNNPINFSDPLGLLQVDEDGEIIVEATGTIKTDRTGQRYSEFKAKTNDGQKVTLLGIYGHILDDNYKTDCHGLTFTDGKYWINNSEVQTILEGDNYLLVDGEKKVGDIGVYRDPNVDDPHDNIRHTVTVTETNAEGTVTEVETKSGRLEADRTTPSEAWRNPADIEWRRQYPEASPAPLPTPSPSTPAPTPPPVESRSTDSEVEEKILD